ncbi:MAG: acetyl-CoA carboxylase biotin carboxyl carrier protein subunit [Bacteroidales bacterium]|nr:acetyl-CoA carboxylase biotin carboxyl carrier protein subunit [Bacteroidales bacterium]
MQFETFVILSAKYQTLLTTKYKNRKKWEPVNEKHVLSFIPGTILKVFVSDKEKVKKEQPLLVLEAMKMENTMFAPFDGTIKKVYVSTGDKVPKGTLMIEFE